MKKREIINKLNQNLDTQGGFTGLIMTVIGIVHSHLIISLIGIAFVILMAYNIHTQEWWKK